MSEGQTKVNEEKIMEKREWTAEMKRYGHENEECKGLRRRNEVDEGKNRGRDLSEG